MRPMNDPKYRYKPWTPERRKAASEAAKARWEERREADRQEAAHYQGTVSAKLAAARYARVQQMNEIVRQYRVLEAEVKEIERAQTLANDLTPILRRFGIKGETA